MQTVANCNKSWQKVTNRKNSRKWKKMLQTQKNASKRSQIRKKNAKKA
jgi:hypothetical protein